MSILHDIRFGIRMLGRSPVFTAVAILSLALGIGAATSIFSLVNAIQLRSLPVPKPHELRRILWSGAEWRSLMDEIQTGRPDFPPDPSSRLVGNSVSLAGFRALREQCAAKADIFGFSETYGGTGQARHDTFIARSLMVSGNFFSGLGVSPLLGRLLYAEDERAGAAPVVVISYRCWEQQFDRASAVIGQSVALNGFRFTVVGVLPSEFPGVRPGVGTDFYASLSAQSQLLPQIQPGFWSVQLMARLKSSVSESQFRAALGIAFLHEAGTVRMKDPRVWLTAGRTGAGGRLQTGSMNDDSARFGGPLWLLLGVVGLVMLVACANLAGLMLARGTARRHEFAVRAALGAGCSQLVRQSLTETVLIALLSGGLGLVLALWGKTLIARLMLPTSEGLYYDTSLDLRVLSFTLGTSLLAALLSGLWPALRAARVDPSDGLKNRVNLGSLHLRTGRVLVSAQITLSLLLLGGAGLFVRTLINLTRIDTGYALDHLLTFTIDLRRSGYKGREPRTVAFFARVEESLAAIPGVDSVALVGWRLLANEGTGEIDFTILGDGSGLAEKNRADGRPFDYRQRDQWANFSFVSERFFETLGIPIVFGRDLRAADFAEAPQAVIVNEAFTRKYSPVRNPIGLTIIDRRNNANLLIVGVCRDAKYGDIQENIRPMVHQLVRQYPAPAGVFILRTSLPPVAVAAAARKAVMAADPNVPLIDFGTLQQVRDGTISRQRTFAVLCGSLAALTLLLSCIGLYGLMAYQVARRTCEIGIRQALGATRRQIAMPILREALALSGIGIAMGTPLTLALTRTIRASFYGVGPADPITFCGAAILFLAVSLIAAWIPALRAARVDPAVALRSG